MELRQLTTFIRVAKFQSFSKAAASLGYSQSAVTVQIRLLEEELKVRLFDRMHKQVILTAQGQQFLDSAYSILQEVNRATLSLAGPEEVLRGQLHIGTLESLCSARLPGVVWAFRNQHPGVRIQITTGVPEELIAKMERGEVDIIYLLDEPLYNNDWNKLLEEREAMVMVASPALGRSLGAGPHRQAAGQALLPHRAGRQLPPPAGPPPGRQRPLRGPCPGEQLRFLHPAHAGGDRGAILPALVPGGGEGAPGGADGGGRHRPPGGHVRTDLLPQGEVDHPGDGGICPPVYPPRPKSRSIKNAWTEYPSRRFWL